MARDLPLTRLDEFDELLDSDEEDERETDHASVDDVQRFISTFGGGEVTLVG